MVNRRPESPAFEVTVERVLPFGVFVRLPNGTRGYIRRRELDLDADAEPAEIVQEGQRIHASLLRTGDAESNIELSRRATLRDPWPIFSERTHMGDSIRGSVRALHPNGAFVRVQAGVNGFLPLAEIATWRVDKPEDVLWIGDTVECIITHLDPENQRLTLSAKAVMAQRDAAKASGGIAEQTAARPAISAPAEPAPPISLQLRNALGPILVVDDHAEVRTSLTSWLNRRGFLAVEAESLETALAQANRQDCGVALIDLNLVDKDGLQLVDRLRKNGSRAHIGVMSSLDVLGERAEELEASQVEEAFPKPLDIDEIEAFLLRLARGQSQPSWRAAHRRPAIDHPLGSVERGYGPVRQGIQTTLEQVTQLMQAEVGLIFHLDRSSQAVSILAKAGDAPIAPEAIYGLNASPVDDVIRDGDPIFENHVSDHAKARFAKLLDLLPFEACIGVPVLADQATEHAAFFFHRKADAFSHYRLRDAQAASLQFAALLSRELLDKQLQSLNPLLLSGELARGFGHDVFNQITALDLEARLLANEERLGELRKGSQRLLSLVMDLEATVQAFQQLLQTKDMEASCDVKRVLDQAIRLLRPIAQKEHSKVEVNAAEGLPSIAGNGVALQQVILNLMINAVQQMSLKAERFQWGGQRLVRVTASAIKNDQRIRIRIADSGPGIHQAHLDKIFTPGFSTRGGSGLGLYIARAFIQSLGGTLRVQETLVPLGTVFAVEVPTVVQEGTE